MNPKSEIYNRWIKASHKCVDRAAVRLAELTPDDPAHWAPNIRSATVSTIEITFTVLIDAHFMDNRKRPRTRAQLVRDLREQDSCQALQSKMVDLGFLVRK